MGGTKRKAAVDNFYVLTEFQLQTTAIKPRNETLWVNMTGVPVQGGAAVCWESVISSGKVPDLGTFTFKGSGFLCGRWSSPYSAAWELVLESHPLRNCISRLV